MARTRNRVGRRNRRASERAQRGAERDQRVSKAARRVEGVASERYAGPRPEYWHGNGWQKWLCRETLQSNLEVTYEHDEYGNLEVPLAQIDNVAEPNQEFRRWGFPKIIWIPVWNKKRTKRVKRPCLFIGWQREVAQGYFRCPDHEGSVCYHVQLRPHEQEFVRVLYRGK